LTFAAFILYAYALSIFTTDMSQHPKLKKDPASLQP